MVELDSEQKWLATIVTSVAGGIALVAGIIYLATAPPLSRITQ
jgi:hypothetical protein